MIHSGVELQQAAKLGAGGLPISIGKIPTGEYMFTGSVPVDLVFERLDGKPLTAEQSRYLTNFYPNKIARDKMGIQVRVFRSKADAIKAAKKIGIEIGESLSLRRRSYLAEGDEADFWPFLYKKNNGVFYRGTGKGGKGIGIGALGQGIYLTWSKGMASAFADMHKQGGEVGAYKVKAGLKMLDSKSNFMFNLKARMGIKPWEYRTDKMFAKVLTSEAKKAGFDGVVSDSLAEGIVVFDTANVEKVDMEESMLRKRLYLGERTVAKMAKEVVTVLRKNSANMPGTMMDVSPTEWTSADKKSFVRTFNGLGRSKSRELSQDISDGIDSSSGDVKAQFRALWNLIGKNESVLGEASGDEVEVNGKKGVWKRVANLNIFFPSDGSDPVGIPKPKNKKQAAKEVIKAKKKVKFFNRLFKHLTTEDKENVEEGWMADAPSGTIRVIRIGSVPDWKGVAEDPEKEILDMLLAYLRSMFSSSLKARVVGYGTDEKIEFDNSQFNTVQNELQKVFKGKKVVEPSSFKEEPSTLVARLGPRDFQMLAKKTRARTEGTLRVRGPALEAYSKDPYLMKAKYAGTDSQGTPFKKGEEIMYYPIGKKILAGKAKDKAWAEFEAAVQDERGY